jgi:hypothetical protein
MCMIDGSWGLLDLIVSMIVGWWDIQNMPPQDGTASIEDTNLGP